jgi:hypothetical protein
MSAFDIPPHPRRTTRLALGVLALVALAAFAEGFLRQLDYDRPPPPPKPSPALAAIAEARPAPAPVLQVAEAPVRPKKPVARDADADQPPLLAVEPFPATAATPPAADAAATAPAADAAAPSPAPAAAPEPPPDHDQAPN